MNIWTKPTVTILAETLAQNTTKVRKTREAKLAACPDKLYELIVKKLQVYSTHSTKNELDIKLFELWDEVEVKQFLADVYEPLTDEEKSKIYAAVCEKLTTERLSHSINTVEPGKHALNIKWECK